jgi:hypothetical protein
MSRLLALLTLVSLPAVAGGPFWEDDPWVWKPMELDWAVALHPQGLSPSQIEATYDAPPRPEWCGPAGMVYPPTQAQCDAWDDELDNWMLDFTGASSVQDLPPHDDPPTYCGGC